MGVSGTDANLASKLDSDINARLKSLLRDAELKDSPALQQICQAIAEQVINHFVAYTQVLVNSGIPVSVTVNIPMDPVTGDFTRTGTGTYTITSTGTTTATGSGNIE